jgi:hypothetical protein
MSTRPATSFPNLSVLAPWRETSAMQSQEESFTRRREGAKKISLHPFRGISRAEPLASLVEEIRRLDGVSPYRNVSRESFSGRATLPPGRRPSGPEAAEPVCWSPVLLLSCRLLVPLSCRPVVLLLRTILFPCARCFVI